METRLRRLSGWFGAFTPVDGDARVGRGPRRPGQSLGRGARSARRVEPGGSNPGQEQRTSFQLPLAEGRAAGSQMPPAHQKGMGEVRGPGGL